MNEWVKLLRSIKTDLQLGIFRIFSLKVTVNHHSKSVKIDEKTDG